MSGIEKKIIFKSCEGYGFQSGSTLTRIQNETLSFALYQPTVYLLDDNGQIVCTIVDNRDAYESEENLDRRYLNNQNGFTIEWNDNGIVCTVICSSRRTAFTVANKVADFCEKCRSNVQHLILQLEVFWNYFVSAFNQNQTQSKNDFKASIRLENFSLQEEARRNKEMLQSNSCTIETLKQVSAWWAKRTDDEVSQLNAYYKFSQALAMYRLFFLARKYDDVRRLLTCKNIFGKRQMDVIREYAKNESRFKDWKRELGMNFSKPYEYQYLS